MTLTRYYSCWVFHFVRYLFLLRSSVGFVVIPIGHFLLGTNGMQLFYIEQASIIEILHSFVSDHPVSV